MGRMGVRRVMQFAATIALGLAPLLVFGGAAMLRPGPAIIPTVVATEGVTARRMDAGTFRMRWSVVSDLPPALVIHEVGGGDAPLRETASKPVDAASSRPPARLVKRAALRTDICSKHGMRKVTYTRGKWQGWRCRR
jgi:hypothetical protein